VLAGHRNQPALARACLEDPEPSVRAAALGALARLGHLGWDELTAALADPDPAVRRRACRVAWRQGSKLDLPGGPAPLIQLLLRCVGDPDPLVGEEAAWALGELTSQGLPQAAGPELVGQVVRTLGELAGDPSDPRRQETAVAALGAIGDPAGLPAVLAALGGRPPLRRRAAVALAGFDDPRADVALRACLADRDWQVREVAEELLGLGPDQLAR
jgi:HEAT repeat protein